MEFELPDVCGNGHHGLVWAQHSWCPRCNRPTIVLRCNKTFDMGCRWEEPVPQHEPECTPDAPVYRSRPKGAG